MQKIYRKGISVVQTWIGTVWRKENNPVNCFLMTGERQLTCKLADTCAASYLPAECPQRVAFEKSFMSKTGLIPSVESKPCTAWNATRKQKNHFPKKVVYELERVKGFEPSTSTLARLRSTPELRPHQQNEILNTTPEKKSKHFFLFFLYFLCSLKKSNNYTALENIFIQTTPQTVMR